jgi:hypothetical protein
MLSKLIGNKRILAGVCLSMCVGLLLVGLWPFNFFPENAVRWLTDTNGLKFQGSESSFRSCAGGVLFSPDPLVAPSQILSERGSFSIEIWLQPSEEPK